MMQRNRLFHAIFCLLAAGLLLLPACGDSSGGGGGGGSERDNCINLCEKTAECSGMSKDGCAAQCANSMPAGQMPSSACRAAGSELYQCMMGQSCDDLMNNNAACTSATTKFNQQCDEDDTGGSTPGSNNSPGDGGTTNPIIESWVNDFFAHCMRNDACADPASQLQDAEDHCRTISDSIRTAAAAVVTTPHRACLDAQAAEWRCRTALSCDVIEDEHECVSEAAAIEAACDDD